MEPDTDVVDVHSVARHATYRKANKNSFIVSLDIVSVVVLDTVVLCVVAVVVVANEESAILSYCRPFSGFLSLMPAL